MLKIDSFFKFSLFHTLFLGVWDGEDRQKIRYVDF